MQMKKQGYDYDDDYDYDDYDWCLTNKQIRKGLKKADFDATVKMLAARALETVEKL